MVKKTKKNEVIIDGNTFSQEFDNLKFVKDYMAWKSHCAGISGEDMFVEGDLSLLDFLENHILNNVRDGSVNAGSDDGSNGATAVLNTIEDIMQDRVITNEDIDDIQDLYDDLREMEDNKTEGLSLDPKLIYFTEKTYDKSGKKIIGEDEYYGHYRTESYVKRRNKKDGGSRKPAPSGWYSGTGNPPSFALFSETGNQFASPKGLLYILEDALKTLSPKKRGSGAAGGKSPVNLKPVIRRIKGKKAYSDLAGIASIERYFDKAIKNDAFWKGGKLLITKLAKDFGTVEFAVSPKESERVIQALSMPKEKTPAGTIKTVKFELTGTPVVLFIKAALQRANTKKAGDGYRAWSTKEFDYRKTAKEVFGEDTGKYRPDQKVIAKKWTDILRG